MGLPSPATTPARCERPHYAALLSVGGVLLAWFALAVAPAAAASGSGGAGTPAPDPAPTGGTSPDPAPVHNGAPTYTAPAVTPHYTPSPVRTAPAPVPAQISRPAPTVAAQPAATARPAVARHHHLRHHKPKHASPARHRHAAARPHQAHGAAATAGTIALPTPEVASYWPAETERILHAAVLEAHRQSDSSPSQPLLPAAIALFLVALAGASLVRLTAQPHGRPRWH